MRFLVIGKNGQIARALMERARAAQHEAFCIGRPELDLGEPASIARSLDRVQADIIVNAAAFTAVDRAELEEDHAMAVNGAGAGWVARAASDLGIPIVHLSTDYVFDGRLDRPYVEDDPVDPLNVYGRSKLAGERAVRAAHGAHAIVRTSWVYSPYQTNFVRTMLHLGRTRRSVDVVADQIGCPTSAFDVADGIVGMAGALSTAPDDTTLHGSFHLAGAGEATWADFAEAIFAYAHEHGRPAVHVNRVTAAAYAARANRPMNSRLDTGKLARTYGIVPPPWQVSLCACLDQIFANTHSEEE